MNASGFHQNVGEGNKSLNALSPDHFLSVVFVKGLAELRFIYSVVDATEGLCNFITVPDSLIHSVSIAYFIVQT